MRATENNSSLRKRNTYNQSHRARSCGADVVTSNHKAYKKFTAQYVGFSRNETRNTIHDYKAVITALNEYYVNHIIETANLVVLPNGLGKFGIQKFKKPLRQKPDGSYNLPLDMNILKSTGKRVYHTNDHTDGNSFKWIWIKPKCNHGIRDARFGELFYAAWWKLKPARLLQLTLAKLLKTEGFDWDKYHYMTDPKREQLIMKRLVREAKIPTNA